MLLPVSKLFASDLKDSASVGMSTYSGTGDVQVYSPAFAIFKTLTSQFMLGVKMRLDAISAASIRNGGNPVTTDAVTGASSKEGFDDKRIATTIMGVYSDNINNISAGVYKSDEVDYKGSSVFASYSRAFNEENTMAGIGFSQSDDEWKPTFSRELAEDKRKEQKVDLSFAQMISPKWNVQLVYSYLYSDGFLSSPYHFIAQDDFSKFESYPDERTGEAIAIKSVNLLSELNSMNFSYRYYDDDWDIVSHTYTVEFLRDFSDELLLGARVRYYTQSDANFIKPIGEYSAYDEYFASDYRMSAFDSYMIGVPLIYKFSLTGFDDIKLTASADYYWTSSNDYIKNWYNEDNIKAVSTTFMFDYQF